MIVGRLQEKANMQLVVPAFFMRLQEKCDQEMEATFLIIKKRLLVRLRLGNWKQERIAVRLHLGNFPRHYCYFQKIVFYVFQKIGDISFYSRNQQFCVEKQLYLEKTTNDMPNRNFTVHDFESNYLGLETCVK